MIMGSVKSKGDDFPIPDWALKRGQMISSRRNHPSWAMEVIGDYSGHHQPVFNEINSILHVPH